MCKKCVKNYYDYLVEFFSGNEEKALDRICSIMDIYYCDEIAVSSKKASTSAPRIASYISKTQMKNYAALGTNYLDTIKDRATNTIDSFEDLDEAKETGEKGVTGAAITRWGLGFSGEEYMFLDSHYKTLKSQISEDDPMQEIYIKDMCVTKVLQSRAQKNNDADKYDKFQKSYQTTAKAANLKPIDKNNDLGDDSTCWGNFIRDVENFSPADLYKDKSLFDDVDGIKEYFNRFIVRPFKNFFMGSTQEDEEFVIHPEDEV